MTENFDFGMDGEVTTPVVCTKHGIKQAWIRINAMYPGWEHQLRESYQCPRCRKMSPVWDRETCPQCGEPAMVLDPDGGMMIWD